LPSAEGLEDPEADKRNPETMSRSKSEISDCPRIRVATESDFGREIDFEDSFPSAVRGLPALPEDRAVNSDNGWSTCLLKNESHFYNQCN
jgi:hypothetical protein